MYGLDSMYLLKRNITPVITPLILFSASAFIFGLNFRKNAT